MNISALSTEYIKVAVAATVNGEPVNPTSDTVQFAFMAGSAAPQVGDWKAGSWETTNGVYYARCLVGPGVGGAITLLAGAYTVWMKIADNPETPVRVVGSLVVT